jgi:hypothetical protein
MCPSSFIFLEFSLDKARLDTAGVIKVNYTWASAGKRGRVGFTL